MDDENMTLARVEQLLKDNLELTQENNRLIREVRRTGRVSFWFRLALWVIVLILPFLLIGPLLQALVPAAGGSGSGSLFGLPSSSQLQEVFEAYQGQLGEE
jgi:hypothetical protein